MDPGSNIRTNYLTLSLIWVFFQNLLIFAHSLMTDIRYNFRKTYWTDFEKTWTVIILVQMIPCLPHFMHNKIFLENPKRSLQNIF